VDTYHARLRSLAKYCQFTDTDRDIKSHIIQTCVSTRLRRRALSEPTLTLVQLLDIARSMEAAERQVKAMENGQGETRDAVAAIGNRSQNQRQRRRNATTTTSNNKSGQLCRNCGNEFPHPGGRLSCPAWGKQCRLCSKPNHFARQCRSSGQRQQQQHGKPPQPTTKSTPFGQVRHVQNTDDDAVLEHTEEATADDEYAFTVDAATSQKQPSATLKINSTRIRDVSSTQVRQSIYLMNRATPS